MNGLVSYLVESILLEQGKGVTVLFPGGFKPPHIGHLNIVMSYFGIPQVEKVVILVGPEERDGITRRDSISMWKILLQDVPNVEVLKSTSPSPLTSAYEYVENAQSGTYALASSTKGEDYARVRKFVEDHSDGGKYAREGINVVELKTNVKPVKYEGRTDKLNGTQISATVLRNDIKRRNLKNFATNYTDLPTSQIKQLYAIATKRGIQAEVLTEGGGAGHLAHPYEDVNLTFQDVANMIDAALSGKLDLAQEKLDGQNLMVSYKNGRLIAARNKGQLKNFGENALTIEQMKKQFSNRGEIQIAFVEAMRDLEAAVDSLSPQQKESVFQNGQNFISLEVLYPGTANVIPYGAAQLRLHHVKSYDENGNVTNETQEPVQQLQTAIDQQKASNQKTYQIRMTDPAKINPDEDYKGKRQEFMNMLNNIKDKYNLSDDDKISRYFMNWWKDFIKENAKSYGYKVPKQVLQLLIKRWAFTDKSTSIRQIRELIDNEDFVQWVIDFDRTGVNDQKKVAGRPVEMLFLKLGARVLKNIQNLVTLNPDDSIRQIKKELSNSIKQIQKAASTPGYEDGTVALKFLKRELGRVKELGGFKSIVPTEGLVFTYKGKLYKLTGLFAPINQILGYLKY